MFAMQAEYCVAQADFCFLIPENYPDIQAAPLLCTGLVGYQAYKKTENAKKIGIYELGSAGHIILQGAKYEKKDDTDDSYSFSIHSIEISMANSNYHHITFCNYFILAFSSFLLLFR